jgi:hypothetical protein
MLLEVSYPRDIILDVYSVSVTYDCHLQLSFMIIIL